MWWTLGKMLMLKLMCVLMVDTNKNKLIITNAKLCLGHEIEYELTVVDDICPIALSRIRLIKSFFFRSGSTVSHHNLVPVAITHSSLPRADLCRLPAPCVSILYEQFLPSIFQHCFSGPFFFVSGMGQL